MMLRRRLIVDLLALALLALVVFVGLSLFSHDIADPPADGYYPAHEEVENLCGRVGALAAANLIRTFGLVAWLLPPALGGLALSWLLRCEHDRPLLPLVGWVLFVLAMAAAAQGWVPVGAHTPLTGNGGLVGLVLWTAVSDRFDRGGQVWLLGSLAGAGLLLWADRWTLSLARHAIVWPAELFRRVILAGRRERREEPYRLRETAVLQTGLESDIVGVQVPRRGRTNVPEASEATPPAGSRLGWWNRKVQPETSGDEPSTMEAAPRLVDGPPLTPVTSAQGGEVFSPEGGGKQLDPAIGVALTNRGLVAARGLCGSVKAGDPRDTGEPSSLQGQGVAPNAGPVLACAAKESAIEDADEPAERMSSLDQEAAADSQKAAANLEGTGLAGPAAARGPVRINPPISIRASSRPAAVPKTDYQLPGAELLELPEPFPFELLAERARGAAAVLEKTFQEFHLNVRVVEIDTGPVITQYELELEPGLRLSKVSALADDLAIALRVPSVRVVAPIPGKNTVGVEVPNDRQVMVRLRELLEAASESQEKKRIPIFLGKDVSGRPLVVDLAKMPHLLIAGRTGTGKSVCLNALILSILMTRTPAQVKLLMIDPKMVELSPYKRVPHLMHPVITDMKKAEAVLAWAVDKMEERYDLLARCGVRHLDSYNELGLPAIWKKLGLEPESEEASQIPATMPYIVIIADEMADMMMTSGKEVEGLIIRLAQKSRAVGIHLVLATQKPTVDVITGLIKSNLPARIAFQVASRVDSRVVLDEMGADKLLGNGDMLYLVPGTSKLTRAQGTSVSDSEVNAIIDFYSDCEPEYSRELAQLGMRSPGKSGIEAIRSRDELYEQAIDVVVREGRGSVSLLQRALGIGYGRAARLVDYMAEDGIVGDYNGSQAREVLYTPEQWAEVVAGGRIPEAAGTG
ncbi:MAG: DNA translocase FtsK 4TM domain-containing protein [Planctomycetaceae bacterium]